MTSPPMEFPGWLHAIWRPDGGWNADPRHPVEHVAPEICLSSLIGQRPGVKPSVAGTVAAAGSKPRIVIQKEKTS